MRFTKSTHPFHTWIRGCINVTNLRLVVDESDVPNMITEQSEASTELAIASSLRVSTNAHVDALSFGTREEQVNNRLKLFGEEMLAHHEVRTGDFVQEIH